MTALPSSIEEVTPRWLSTVLAGNWPGAAVSAVEVVDIFDGTSSRIRLKIDRNETAVAAGIPQALCLKANWTEHADFTLGMGIWANEARFYHSLRPQLEMNAPRGFYGGHDLASGQGIILMEDLVAMQASFGSNGDALSIDQAAAVLDDLSVLHARWWDSPALEAMDWMPHSFGANTIDANCVNYQGGAAGFAKLLEPAERAATLSANANDPDRIAAMVEHLVQHESTSTAPRCVIHGDTHLGNSYYLPDGSMGWLDWQLVRRGRPMREVNYFLGCALTTADRRSAERQLITHYLECLRSKGVDPRMDTEAAWQEYRRWPVWGLIGWAVTGDDWQPVPVILETMRRFGAAIDDLETYKFLS
jgi:Ecdysteroid kinase-like family